MEIFKMFGSILVENDPANKAIDETDKKSKGLAGTLGTVAKGAAVVGGALIAAGAGAYKMASSAAEVGDRVDKLSQKIGLSRQGFQEWDYVLGQNGIQVEKLQTGIKTMTDAMGGVGQGAKAFEALGISLEDSTGKMRSQEEVFKEAVTALQGIEDQTLKASLATDLFGKAGTELMPLLNQTAEGTAELTQRAHDLGLVMSDEAVNSSVLFSDTMDDLKQSFGMVGTEIGVAIMPLFQKLAEWIIKNMPTIKAIFSEVFGTIKEVLTPIVVAFRDNILPSLIALYEWAKPYLPMVKEFFKDAFGVIGSVISGVFKTIDLFIEKAKAVYDWAQKIIDKVKAAGTATANSYSGTYSNLTSGKKAIGGPVAANSAYLVGEEGPEIFMPNQAGTIIPNGAGRSITLNFYDTNIMDDYGVDRLMDRVVERLAVLNV